MQVTEKLDVAVAEVCPRDGIPTSLRRNAIGMLPGRGRPRLQASVEHEGQHNGYNLENRSRAPHATFGSALAKT